MWTPVFPLYSGGISQSISVPAGTYTLRYKFRNTYDKGAHDYSVFIKITNPKATLLSDIQTAGSEKDYEGEVTFVSEGVEQTITFLVIGKFATWEIIYLSVCEGDNAIFELIPNCAETTQLTVIPVVVTSPTDAGKNHHIGWSWTDGTTTSPSVNRFVEFGDPPSLIISDYATYVGDQGANSIPPNLATVSMQALRQGADSYTFDGTNDKMRYLRSNTLYAETEADITALLLASTELTPSGADATWTASFALDNTSNQYLYLIWDLRDRQPEVLCASNPSNRYDYSAEDACCNCSVSDGCTPFKTTLRQTNAVNACAAPKGSDNGGQDLYHDGDGVYPVVGDTIYFSGCVTAFTGVVDRYFGLTNNTWIKLDANGVVVDANDCGVT